LLIEIGVRKLTEKKKKRKLWVATFQPQKKTNFDVNGFVLER
jgi:hypothetical protein